MAFIQRSFLSVAVVFQAGCFSTEPSRPQSYPVPDPSVFASLNCEEIAHKRDGYQQLLQNITVDHPTDSHLYVPMYLANSQGLSNAFVLRNCPVSGQVSAMPAGSDSYCFAYYTDRNLMEPTSTTTGVVSKLWQAGAIAGAPAQVALTEFQTYLVSYVKNEQLGSPSCETVAHLQSCSITKADSGSFSHGVRLAQVICSTSREGIEKSAASIRVTNPLIRMVDWKPARASAIPASLTVVTPSSIVTPSSVASPVTPALKSPSAPMTSGQLGVYASPVTPTVVKSFGLPGRNGVLILGPVPGSNAERDGMLAGDIILTIDGTPVNSPAELTAISSQMRPGSQVPLRVWRYRAAIDVNVEISAAGQ